MLLIMITILIMIKLIIMIKTVQLINWEREREKATVISTGSVYNAGENWNWIY